MLNFVNEYISEQINLVRESHRKKPLILLIDDSPTIQKVLTKILTEASYSVISTSNGNEGIKLALSELPDLIILDIIMKKVDGFETCRFIKENVLTKKIPVFFLTSKKEPEFIAKGLCLGAFDYILKSFFPEQILSKISVCLEYVKLQNKTNKIESDFINSKEQFQTLIKNIPNLVFEMDVSGKIIFISDYASKILGYSPENIFEMKNIDVIKYIYPDDRKTIKKIYLRFLKKDKPFNADFRIFKRDGKCLWVNCRIVKNIRNDETLYFTGIITDITEDVGKVIMEKNFEAHKLFLSISERFINTGNFEKDITESLKLLNDFSGVSRTSIYRFSPDYSECFLIYEGMENNEFKLMPEYLKFSSGEIDVLMTKLLKNQLAIINDVESLSTVSQNTLMFFKNRKIFSCISAPVNIDDKVFGFFTLSDMRKKHFWQEYEVSSIKIASDIISKALSNFFKTEQLKQNSIQIAQSSKLASMGTMVAGVAHEINNPNTFISLNIPIIWECWNKLKKLLQDSKSENYSEEKISGNDIKKYIGNIDRSLEHIKSGSDRICGIVNTLKEFSHNDESENNRDFSIKECYEKAWTIVGAMVRRKVNKVEANIEENLPRINGNQVKMEQVIINLLQNAADAVDNIHNGLIQTAIELINNQTIRISIKDNGIGVKKENLSKLFEPFFSTKNNTGGTGLGLSISYKIVKEHNGDIKVLSEENQGALFIIDLPVNSNKYFEKIKPVLLVVDDEEEILNYLKALLNKNSIDNIIIKNPLKAAEIIEKNINTDIVITDILMPSMNGFELIKSIKERFPWIKFICMSAFLSGNEVEKLLENGVKAFFKKPFENHDLIIKKIKELR